MHQGSGRARALIVAINQYQDGISPLRSAVADATALGQLLTELHGYTVSYCLDRQATRQQILEWLRNLADELDPDDRFLFYFAGHGVVENDAQMAEGTHGYFIPADATRNEPGTFLSMQEVQAHLARLKCRHLFTILDSCFAGAFRWSATRSLQLRPQRLYRERYERYLRDPAWQVLSSAAHNEVALDILAGHVIGSRGESGTHSPFAQALLDGLRGAADFGIDGEPGDGIIVVTELYLYIEARLAGLEQSTVRRQQRPMLWSLLGKDQGQYLFHVPNRLAELPSALLLNEENNPYRGLSAYKEQNHALFFGRAEPARELCERVRSHRLVVVTGASGVGKSSLVQAGLLPRLRSDGWTLLEPVRPGREPARVLDQLSKEAISAVPATLPNTVGASDGTSQGLLLVIDQLEEVLTFGCAKEERSRFFAQLADLLGEGHRGLHVVLTVRADFKPLFDAELGDTASYYWIPPMGREALRQAILGPASERVLYFDPPTLVERLLDEVVDVPGALPLLSFTLSEMYRAFLRSAPVDRNLREQDYQVLGGVAGALSQRADKIHGELSTLQQATMRRLMLRMVALEGGELSRRRVDLGELVQASAAEQERVDHILRRMVDERLLTTGQDSDGNRYVEPAHDKLVLSWSMLFDWIQQERGALQLHRELTRTAAAWSTDRRNFRLWHDDARLPQLRTQLVASPHRFNAQEQSFIKQSARRRRNGILVLASVITAVVMSLSGAAYYSAAKAEEVRRQLRLAYVEQGRQKLQDGRPMEALLWLNRAYQEGTDDPALRYLLAEAVRPIEALQVTLEGHLAGVNYASFSSDGRRVLTSSVDKTTRIWDARTGKNLLTLQGQERFRLRPVWSRDGRRVLTGTPGNSAELSDTRTGQQLLALQGNPWPVSVVALSTDETRILTGGENTKARVWDAQTGELIHALGETQERFYWMGFSPDGTGVVTCSLGCNLFDAQTGQLLLTEKQSSSAVFSPDSSRLLFGGSGRVYDPRTGKLLFNLAGGMTLMDAAAWSPDGSRIATRAGDRAAKLWNATNGKLLITLAGHESEVKAVAFSPDSKRVATASLDRSARIWDAITGQLLATFEGHQQALSDVAWSPDGAHIVTASSDHSARVWDARSGKLVSKLDQDLNFFRGPTTAFSPDGTQLITTMLRQGPTVWDARTGIKLSALKSEPTPGAQRDEAQTVIFSPDGTRLITTGLSHSPKLWDAQTYTPLFRLTGHTGLISSATFSRDGTTIITASHDKTAKVWNSKTGSLLYSLEQDEGVYAAAFSPDGTFIFTSGKDTAQIWDAKSRKIRFTLGGTLHDNNPFSADGRKITTTLKVYGVWDVKTGQLLFSLGDDSIAESSRSAEWSPDGTRVLSRSGDNTARLWDSKTGKRLATLTGHHDRVISASFSRDGNRVLTTSGDSTLKLWDTRTGQLLSTLEGHTGKVTEAQFSPDGRRLLSRCLFDGLMLWDVHEEQRSRAEMNALVRCRVPLTFLNDVIVPSNPDEEACSRISGRP